MKKLYITVFILFCAILTKAQNCEQATFYTEPASFTAEDEVTLYVDVNGCSYLASLDEVYLWIFVPGGPGPDGLGGNGDFCNGSNSELLMNNEGDGLWSFTFTPTELFDASPSEIGTEIGFIPKEFAACKGNGDQTVDLFVPVESLEFIPSESRTFPEAFTDQDFVTLYFDQKLALNEAMAELDDIFIYVFAEIQDGEGNSLGSIEKAAWTDVSTTEELQMINEGDGVYSLTMDLRTFFPVEEGNNISNISFIYRNADGTVQTDTYSAQVLGSN